MSFICRRFRSARREHLQDSKAALERYMTTQMSNTNSYTVLKMLASCRAKPSTNKQHHALHNRRFPRDAARREAWERAVNRDQWTSTPSSCICSEHFVKNDFYLTENGLRRLGLDAVPSINISVCQEQDNNTISQMEPIDLCEDDTAEVIMLKYKVRRLEVIAENRKRRLNLMWQGKRRLKKKLENMTFLLKQLIKTVK